MKNYTDMKDLAKDALLVQDACNLVAVLGSMHAGAKFLAEKGLGTDQVRRHPAMVLFADKVVSLCGRPGLGEFGVAMQSCRRMSEGHSDPIHFEGGSPGPEGGNGWYFWDETWASRLGPYPSRTCADVELRRYGKSLEGPDGVDGIFPSRLDTSDKHLDLYTVDDFESAVRSNAFTDFDGYGYPSDGISYTNAVETLINPSNWNREALPAGTTHIKWISR